MLLYNLDINNLQIGSSSIPDNMLVSSKTGTLGSDVFQEVVEDDIVGKCLMFKVISDGTINIYRSEISGDGAGRNALNENILARISNGTELYISFKVFIPKTNIIDSGIGIFQMHYDNISPGSPPLLLELYKGNFDINHKYNKTLNADRSTDIFTANTRRSPLEFDKWVEFILHIKTENINKGITRVWKDKKLLYSNYSLPNNFNVQKDPPNDTSLARNYLKFGLYCFDWKTNPPEAGREITVFYKDINIGTEYSDVS